MKIRILLIILAVVCAPAAWTGEGKFSVELAANSLRSPSPEGAEVGFITPIDGDSVPLSFPLEFFINGMTVEPAGTDVKYSGHHHLLIDVDELPDLNLPIPKNDNFLHFGGGQTETVLALPAGDHTLQLLFGDYIHVPHDPIVISDRITIHVTEDQQAANQD